MVDEEDLLLVPALDGGGAEQHGRRVLRGGVGTDQGVDQRRGLCGEREGGEEGSAGRRGERVQDRAIADSSTYLSTAARV